MAGARRFAKYRGLPRTVAPTALADFRIMHTHRAATASELDPPTRLALAFAGVMLILIAVFVATTRAAAHLGGASRLPVHTTAAVRWASSAHGRVVLLRTIAVAVLAAATLAAYALHVPADHPIPVPPHGPPPDVWLEDRIVIGVGRTRRGTAPGMSFRLTPDEEADSWYDDAYLSLTAEGLFNNAQVTGGTGSGKTTGCLHNYTWQAIAKYPRPVDPDTVPLGRNGRYPKARTSTMRARFAAWFRRECALWHLPVRGGDDDAANLAEWHPYAGLTPAEARARYAELLALHERRRWGLLVIDRKGDLTDIVRRQAALANRLDDVVVLEPGGAETHNPLLSSDDPSALARVILTAHEAVREAEEHPFYGPAQSEWLSHAIALIQAAAPARRSYPLLLALCRDEAQVRSLLRTARQRLDAVDAARIAAEQGGRIYDGPVVSRNTIAFFENWLAQKQTTTRQDILRGVTAFCSLFEDAEMATFLCPELPPTFTGFHTIWDEGAIVIVRVPEGRFGNARATAVGVQLLCEAQTAALARPTSLDLNQERVATFVIDEATHYLNRYLTRFLSQNRQSRVAVVLCHQVVSQLSEWSTRHAKAFIGSTRTKIAFGAPEGLEAAELSAMLGTRAITHRATSASTSRSHTRMAAKRHGAPGGRTASRSVAHAASTSERTEQQDWPWFNAGDLHGLDKFEAIVMEFDGARVLAPRKVVTRPYFQTAAYAAARAVTLPAAPTRPHPLVGVPSDPLIARAYVDVVLNGPAFVILDPLVTDAGKLLGCLFTNHAGSLVVPRAVLWDLAPAIRDALEESTRTVAVGAVELSGVLLVGDLACKLTRTFRLDAPAYSWERYASPGRARRALVTERRARVDAFQTAYARVAAAGDDALASHLDETAAALRRAAEAARQAPRHSP